MYIYSKHVNTFLVKIDLDLRYRAPTFILRGKSSTTDSAVVVNVGALVVRLDADVANPMLRLTLVAPVSLFFCFFSLQ